jgi:hypothetical protein
LQEPGTDSQVETRLFVDSDGDGIEDQARVQTRVRSEDASGVVTRTEATFRTRSALGSGSAGAEATSAGSGSRAGMGQAR